MSRTSNLGSLKSHAVGSASREGQGGPGEHAGGDEIRWGMHMHGTTNLAEQGPADGLVHEPSQSHLVHTLYSQSTHAPRACGCLRSPTPDEASDRGCSAGTGGAGSVRSCWVAAAVVRCFGEFSPGPPPSQWSGPRQQCRYVSSVGEPRTRPHIAPAHMPATHGDDALPTTRWRRGQHAATRHSNGMAKGLRLLACSRPLPLPHNKQCGDR